MNKYFGMYRGVITNIEDSEKRGRVKCKIPSVLGDKAESAWCEPVSQVAYDNGGDFCVPKLKETVWIMFIEGNVNMPVYLGGWWKKEKSPLGSNYKTDTRVINYANCTMVLKNNTIAINVGGGDVEMLITKTGVEIKGKITLDGDVTIKGNVNAGGNISASGTVNGSNI